MYNPFAAYRVTQGFSSKHPAVDYGLNVGTPLPAPSDGVVTYRYFADAGYTATITRPDGSWTRYAHGMPWLVAPAPHPVKQGEPVKMLSGNSGISSGPHLHAFDVAPDGTRMPPFTTGLSLAGDDGQPITEQRRKNNVTLYYCTSTDRPSSSSSPEPVLEYALAGDSPGTSANWLAIADPVVVTALAQVHGSAVFLTRDSYAAFRGKYTEPLRVSGGAAAPFDPASILSAIAEVPAKTRAEIIRD